MTHLFFRTHAKLALASIAALAFASGCSAPTEEQADDQENTGVSTAALTNPPALAGFSSAGLFQIKNGFGNYCMQRRSNGLAVKSDGKACSKSVATQQWVAYSMPDGMYRLCVPDTLAPRYKYLIDYSVSPAVAYDGYFATCFGDSTTLEDTLLSRRVADSGTFTAQPGHIDARSDGRLKSVTALAGANFMRLRTDDFRIDWAADKTANNYTWSALAW